MGISRPFTIRTNDLVQSLTNDARLVSSERKMADPTQVTLDAPLPASMTDRVTPQHGATKLMDPTKIDIKYNAEPKDTSTFLNCIACFLGGCSYFSKERQYIYLRENSIELNVGLRNYCGDTFGCIAPDCVTVHYFDGKPLGEDGCGPCKNNPKIEVMDSSCYFCCVKCEGDKSVVVVPFDTLPPCYCQTNRTNAWSSCCHLLGPVEGRPLVYQSYFVQPTNPEKFVTMAQQVMSSTQKMK